MMKAEKTKLKPERILTDSKTGYEGQKRSDRYLYISGLVRALELNLLSKSQMNRLYEARESEDIERILSEAGYPTGEKAEQVLQQESIKLLQWFCQLMPEAIFGETLLIFHDAHNIKLVLKQLLTVWLAGTAKERQATMEIDPQEEVVDFGQVDGLPPAETAMKQALLPALVEPIRLYRLISEQHLSDLPEWHQKIVAGAIKLYLTRYELSDVDLFIDRQVWQRAHDLAAVADDAFFSEYLQTKADLINIDVLLRSRDLSTDPDRLKKTFVPGGTLDCDELLALLGADEETLASFFDRTPYRDLVRPTVLDTDKRGLYADNLLLDLIRRTRFDLSGPQIPLAFLLARQLEIKNVQIVLTFLRNNLPVSQARELVRDSLLAWR